MTKELAQEGEITERDKVFSPHIKPAVAPSSPTTSLPARGVRLSGHVRNRTFSRHPGVKFVGANILRVWLNFEERRNQRKERKHDNSGPQKRHGYVYDGARRGFTIATTNLLPNVVRRLSSFRR